MLTSCFCLAVLCLPPGLSSAADSPADFLPLLEQLQNAKNPQEAGFDQFADGNDNPGRRIVRMLGSPQTWDAYGTPRLRKAVIERLRKRWALEGEAMLAGLRPKVALPGHVEMTAGDLHFGRDLEKMRRQFFLNNGRLYELGAMDGAFPPSGFMLGDQSGIWAPPIKALDSFAFVVRENAKPPVRLDESSTFAHDFATATFSFTANDLAITRTDFPAAVEPSLFSRLTITNTAKTDRTLDVDFIADINIRPDWRTAAHNAMQNDLDIIESREGLVRAWDPNLGRSMIALGADRPATQVKITDPQATLTYRLTIPAGGTVTLNCLIQTSLESANLRWPVAFRTLAARSQQELEARKSRESSRMQAGLRFTCSDDQLTQAFLLAKANLALLTADCRPHFPSVYLMAGVPVYPRLFACDSCISLPGATAAGFWPEAKGTLTCLAQQGRANKSLVPHESATDATQIGPSNSQETTQFIATCAHYLRWSGDQKFASELYPLLTSAMASHRAKFARDGYPAGNALIETHGMGARKIDAACWHYAALSALAEVAHSLAHEQEARAWRAEATRFQTNLQKDWWIEPQHIWADSLDTDAHPKQGGLWSIVFPLITYAANPQQAALTLDALESGWINQWGGVHTRQPDITQQGAGVVTTGVFAQAAFANQRADLGLRLLLLNAKAPFQDRMPGSFTEMIPAGGSDFAQLWSIGPFLSAIVEGLGGIHPNASAHTLEINPQLPANLDFFTLDNLKIGEHELRLDARRKDKTILTTLTHIKGPAPLQLSFVPTNEKQTLAPSATATFSH